MRILTQLFLLLIIFSCSQENDVSEQNEISPKVITGPFLKRNGLLYIQDTNDLVQGTVDVYSGEYLSERKDYKKGMLDGKYDKYYVSGQLSSREIYSNGKTNGIYEWFWENGQLSRQGTYKNGIEIGITKFYNPDGDLNKKWYFNNSTSKIYLEEIYENSILIGRFEFKNGQRNGQYRIYRNNSILKEKGEYLSGNKHGVIKSYNEQQQLELEVEYLNEIKIGSVDYTYRDNGSLRSKITKTNNKNDNIKVFNSKGNLVIDANTIPESLTYDGLQKGFYADGSPKFMRIYNDGVIEINLSKYYDKNDDVIEDGIIFEYYPDADLLDGVAQLEYEYEIKNGMRNGFFQRWYEDGTIHLRGFYKDGISQEGFEQYKRDGTKYETPSLKDLF